MSRQFAGKWISDREMANAVPRNVFHRQLSPIELDCSKRRGLHILFRRSFELSEYKEAVLYVTADDYYKLYINGEFVCQGPAPSYHFNYNYNTLDVTPYLKKGKNVIALHTYYQGLINRVWQSGDDRHGMLCDLVIDGETVVSSDESFLTRRHSGYRESGVCGYDTQLLEDYDSRSEEVGFEGIGFDDSGWENATFCAFDDHVPAEQKSKSLVFEKITPKSVCEVNGRTVIDLGGMYVGYLSLVAEGKAGDEIVIRCGQELNGDGSVRYQLRANCVYEEKWTLADGESVLDQFDYKSFRYVEIEKPEGVVLRDISALVRHYPFTLKAKLRDEYSSDPELRRIWELCVRTQKYGVQEVIQDCMEREKGFYVGDGCYTALTHMVLTGDDSMVRKLIDDAFSSAFITDTLVTCLDCSHMQEIAEYPLMLIYLVLWHYRYTGDLAYLEANYPKVTALLDAYRRDYERDGLLSGLDKWCVVEWPKNFQHGYDVELTEGKVCEVAHVSLNAYYLYAIKRANEMASVLGRSPYRAENTVEEAFNKAFYDPSRKLYKDSGETEHISLVGNTFVYAFGLTKDAETSENILKMLDEHKISSLSMFCTFPMLMGLVLNGEGERIRAALKDEGAWLRILSEDGTATFEGWGRDTKWNTSLFHMTMSYAALFMSDADLKAILR